MMRVYFQNFLYSKSYWIMHALILIHDQWKEVDPYYENSNKAWWMILNNTKTLVETGSTLDFGEIS